MIDVVDGLDLSGLPIPFLEAHPFPSFVLSVSLVKPSRPKFTTRDTDVTVRHYVDDVSPLGGPSNRPSHNSPIVWSNEKWLQLTQGRSFEDCFDSGVTDRFQSWIEGEAEGDDSLFVVDLREPAITLHLAKTIVLFTPPSLTHAFCVITSQSRRQRPASTPSDMGSPSLRSSYSFFTQRPDTNDRSSFSTEITDSPSEPLTSYFPSTYSRERRQKTRMGRKPSVGDVPLQMSAASDEMWKLMDEVDWSQTSLGPRELWATQLDALISVTFQSQTQDALWLGDESILIYNKAYSELIPDHPATFARPAKEVWAAIWDYIQPIADNVRSGVTTYKQDDYICITTFGDDHKLEQYFTSRWVPIRHKDGQIFGLLNQATEGTEKILAERRLSTIREMSEQMLLARSSREYYDSIADVFEENIKDVPFLLSYSAASQVVDGQVKVELNLESSLNVPDNHPSAPQRQTILIGNKTRTNFGLNADRLSSPTLSAISALSSGSGRNHHTVYDSLHWPIQKALSTRQCVVVENCSSLVRDFPLCVWDELPFSAIVVPICSDNSSEIPEAVLILGLSVQRPFDEEYDNWVHVLRGQLTSSLASVKSYEAEERRMEDAARMERAKASWFRGAAHDLRSPLTLIAGPIEDLLGTSLTPSQKDYVVTAKRNTERLMRLVNALMDFSRLEAGRVTGRFVPLDLGSFVSELALVFRPAIERMKVAYHVDIEPYDKLVYVDPTLFETIVSNLIGNALKYTVEGSITVRVRYGEMAEITVMDTGVGIPAEELDQVSEWYHRATTAVHSGTQGTGLGLALAKELLHLHDGELVVSSMTADENRGVHGSIFTARIPLTPREITDVAAPDIEFGTYGKAIATEALRWAREDETESSDAGRSDTHDHSTIGSGSKRSDGYMFEKGDVLLLVDDNIDMRAYIKRIFSPYCEVIEASNGEQALAIATKSPPHLILSDVMMPKMNGLELLEKIRAQPETRIVPMVLLSAMTGDEARVDALLMGAEDYIEKPFKPKELLARAHLHMQVGKKRAKLEEAFTQREVQIATMSDYCPSGIMRSDGSGHLTYANAAFRRIAGMDDDVDPDLWPTYCEDSVVQAISDPWFKFIDGDEKELKLTFKWRNGRSVSGIYIRLDKILPTLSGILGCVTDITHEEERLKEAELRRMEAEESKHQQELLIDLTSHEIRTPVSAILQCSSLVKENLVALKEQLRFSSLKGFKPTPELLEDLEEDVEALESECQGRIGLTLGIYQCGLVQERIAGDVLSLARIQLDMLTLHDIEMDLRREGRKVLSVFASEAKMKKIELALEFGDTLNLTKVYDVKTDPVRLGQVITNLISNAIRFTASSDVRKITVSYDVSFVPPVDDSCALPSSIGLPANIPAAEDTPIWLFISVRDTGPGLGPKELAQLFKRFSQGNKMIHTRFGGSGLGLFICKKITELLGGRIEVKSQLGEGSVFRFFVQVRTAAHLSPIAAMVQATSPPSSLTVGAVSSLKRSEPMRSGSTMSIVSSVDSNATAPSEDALHILIVEDNIINQTVLKRQMIKAGLTCDVANNGLEALNLIREADRQSKRGGVARRKLYNVVLMDLEMPVMDGLTALREIRSAEAAGTLARNMVIALTGNARQGQIDTALEAGMDDVVIKPYVLGNLLQKIRHMSQRKVEINAAAHAAL